MSYDLANGLPGALVFTLARLNVRSAPDGEIVEVIEKGERASAILDDRRFGFGGFVFVELTYWSEKIGRPARGWVALDYLANRQDPAVRATDNRALTVG